MYRTFTAPCALCSTVCMLLLRLLLLLIDAYKMQMQWNFNYTVTTFTIFHKQMAAECFICICLCISFSHLLSLETQSFPSDWIDAITCGKIILVHFATQRILLLHQRFNHRNRTFNLSTSRCKMHGKRVNEWVSEHAIQCYAIPCYLSIFRRSNI